MQMTLKKLMFLFALVCTVICCVALVACAKNGGDDGNDGNGGNDGNKITYTVTVTSDDSELNFTLITAQWKSGAEVKGSAKLSESGAASVQLDEGNYTVSLADVPEDYKYSEATATTAEPGVKIEITKERKTKKLNLMVTAPVGLSFPADAKVQVYDKNNDAVGAPQTVVSGLNSIDVPNNGEFKIVFIDCDYLKGEVSAIATDNLATLKLAAKDIEYTVTVNVGENVELDGAMLALNNGSEDVATEEIVEGGEIVITAPAGDYTVEVRELSAKYRYESANLSYDSKSRTATVEISAIFYTVNVEALNSSIDLSAITVELLDGENVVTQSTVEGTVAKLYAAEGEYTINATSSKRYGFIIGEFDADKEATVKVAPIPEGGTEYLNSYGKSQGGDAYNINGVGGYYIEVLTYLGSRNVYMARTHTFTFTAPEEGRKLYKFTWQYLEHGDSLAKRFNYGTATEFEVDGESISYILSKGETAHFALTYTPDEYYDEEINWNNNYLTEDPCHFVLMIEAEVAPEEGDILLPKVIEFAKVEGDHIGSEGMTDVYFKIMPAYSTDAVYTITFAAGTQAYFGSNINSLSKIDSGDNITLGDYSPVYLRITSDGAPVKFNLKKYVVLGATPIDPIVLLQGEENRLTFDFSGGSETVWLVFTPKVTGIYYIYGELEEDAITVGDKYNDIDGYDIWWPPLGYNGDQLSMTAGKKYYLMLNGPWGTKASFYIDLYNG